MAKGVVPARKNEMCKKLMKGTRGWKDAGATKLTRVEGRELWIIACVHLGEVSNSSSALQPHEGRLDEIVEMLCLSSSGYK